MYFDLETVEKLENDIKQKLASCQQITASTLSRHLGLTRKQTKFVLNFSDTFKSVARSPLSANKRYIWTME